MVTHREEKIKAIVDDIMEKLPDPFNMAEIMGKVEERTPYVVVAFQECERMNILTREMRRYNGTILFGHFRFSKD